MAEKTDVRQGTLALMVLKTLQTTGPLHGYGIARRIEQTSGNLLSLNYGTLYPGLLKLEQEDSIVSESGVSENNRKAKFYKLTRAGRKQLEKEARDWVHGRAHAELGKLADLRGDRRVASDEYSVAIHLARTANDSSGLAEAEHLLATPYR